MPTQTSAPQASRGDKTKLAQNSIENFIANEKSRVETAGAAYRKEQQELLETPAMKKAWAFLDEKAKVYQTAIEKFDKTDPRFDAPAAVLRNEIRKQAFRKFPELLELVKLNSKHADQLQTSLHTGLIRPYNTGLIADPEVVIGEYDYVEFEPPYPQQFAELNVGNNFAEDDSFPWADWGTMHTNVLFNHSHSWTEISGGTSKYGYNTIGMGIDYTMPRPGSLDLTFVLKPFNHSVNYKISDHYGPSGAAFDVSHMIFFPVHSHGSTIFNHAITLLDKRIESGGSNKSGELSEVALNTPIVVNFKTDQIHPGEELQIMIDSFFRISSSVTCMKTNISAVSLLKVEKIYLRVVS